MEIWCPSPKVWNNIRIAFTKLLWSENTPSKQMKLPSILTQIIGAGTVKGNLATVNTDQKNEDLKMLLEMAYPIEEQSDNFWTIKRSSVYL